MKKLFFYLLFLLPVFTMAQQIILDNKDTLIITTKDTIEKKNVAYTEAYISGYKDSAVTSIIKVPILSSRVNNVTSNITYPITIITLKPYNPITPSPVNHAPTANAGADKTLQLPGSITITGQGSDPDGDAISYTWSEIKGGIQSFVTSNASFTLNNPASGTYIYRLRVLDSKGLDATDDMTLTIKEATQPPSGGTYQISFPQLTSDYTRPGSGAEYWYGGLAVAIPGIQPQDRYYRFNWAGLNPKEGQYNWTLFDQQINACIDNNHKFSFGIMSQYSGGKGSQNIASFGGGASAYPEWVHAKMQTESVKDVLSSGDWVPNYNSPSYLAALEKFYLALADHLNSTTYKGTLYKDAINYIDIRGYGNFGEWHNWPYGTNVPSTPTIATLIKIIDIHKTAFPDFRLSAMVDGMDGGGWSNMPAQISYKLLTDKNNVGDFGIRRDSWGATDRWYNQDLWENNPASYNGQKISTLMMNKWKTAPITGEPYQATGYSDLANQVVKYHVNSFGNGNGPTNSSSSYIAAANKASGNKVSITSATLVVNPGAIAVTMNWANSFIPMYEDVKVVYELRQGSTIKFSMQSSFTPTLFQPGTKTVTDNMNNVPSGTYDLYIVVKDVSGYRNVALGIQGNRSGYLIKSGISL